jgi:hypothetical protein
MQKYFLRPSGARTTQIDKCMHVCMYVCVSLRSHGTRLFLFENLYACVCVCLYVFVCVCPHTHTHTHIHTKCAHHSLMQTHVMISMNRVIHLCMSIYMCVHIYVYADSYTRSLKHLFDAKAFASNYGAYHVYLFSCCTNTHIAYFQHENKYTWYAP